MLQGDLNRSRPPWTTPAYRSRSIQTIGRWRAASRVPPQAPHPARRPDHLVASSTSLGGVKRTVETFCVSLWASNAPHLEWKLSHRSASAAISLSGAEGLRLVNAISNLTNGKSSSAALVRSRPWSSFFPALLSQRRPPHQHGNSHG